MIRIGFDAKRAFQNHTGLGVYSRCLLKEVVSNEHTELFLFTPRVAIPFIESNNRIHIERPPQILQGALSSIWRSLLIIFTIRFKQLDVYHGLSGELPFGIGWLKKTKKIVTIHDVLFKRFPDDYPFVDRLFYNWKTYYAIHRADIVVSVSEATKQDLVKYYNIDSSKVLVIENTLELVQYQKVKFDDKIELPIKFICQIATFIPRKNQSLTIESFIKIANQVDFDLVLVGTGKKYYKTCVDIAKASDQSHRIHFIGRISSDQLNFIYQKAWINIYPSMYEGFGIPILEAMACHCPNIISNVLPLVEVAGNAAMVFELTKKGDLAKKILKMSQDNNLRKQYMEKGVEQIKKFSPNLIYPKLINCYFTHEFNNL